MELKVNVDGVERSISGVSNETTCAQIIYALAHATSQKGRFVMIEKFKKKERRLSPVDKPMELLEKFREHRSNVSFVLKKVDEKGECNMFSVSVINGICREIMGPLKSTDYNAVMEQKFSSIGRGAIINSTLPAFEDEDNSIARMSLSHNDLRILIEKQRSNLRNILTPIKESDWPQQYQKQLKKSHKLRAAIEATKEAINKTTSDVEKVLCEEVELQKKLSELNESPSTPPRAAATLPISSSTSSTLKAC
ncbi:unnamed protein product [Angiostrongylus costaricensis]|uniref:Ras-associating domain-containing protein n=1 Tax=Angiostrongylus costaricensis TaxID=334426 RepID=A0A158PK89_ANGCS|nr:unnamed protein product [Angiostrongylus costaricensis]